MGFLCKEYLMSGGGGEGGSLQRISDVRGWEDFIAPKKEVLFSGEASVCFLAEQGRFVAN